MADVADVADVADDLAAAPDVIRFIDTRRGVYQKLVVRDGRLVGAILLGDTRTVGTVTQLFDRGAALPADRAACCCATGRRAPAAGGSLMVMPGTATICQCNGVTKAAICAAWQGGAHWCPSSQRRGPRPAAGPAPIW